MALISGAEDKKKVVVAAVLGVVVLMVAAWAVWTMYPYISPGAPPTLPPRMLNATTQQVPPATPAPQAVPNQQTATGHEAKEIPGSLAALDPTLHPEWMAAAESLKYEGSGRNIFSMSSVPVHIEKPQGPIRPGGKATQVAQGPPGPPPIDLKFFGYEAHGSGARKIFLLHGDDVFIASQGDVVDHRYKILQIEPLSVTVQDIPYNDTQTLPLIQN
jgi:hypothetical protein